MTIGRPPKWKKPEDMEAAIEAYYKRCDEGRDVHIIRKTAVHTVKKRLPYTVIGLAVALGFSSRTSVHDYVKRNKHSSDSAKRRFATIIAQAKAKIEQDTVEGASVGDFEPKISALNLATNYHYTTKQEIQLNEKDKLTDDELDAKIKRLLVATGLTTEESVKKADLDS